jgi:hypothetical protein
MGNWFGDESDPWNQVDDSLGIEDDGQGGGNWVGSSDDVWNADLDSGNDSNVQRLLDVPADAGETTTGTGENTGWFGAFDRAADPRSWSGEEPDWAEPSEQTDGISGFFAGATGATGHVVDEASSGAGSALMQSPKLLALAVLAFLMVLAPYAGMAANLSE